MDSVSKAMDSHKGSRCPCCRFWGKKTENYDRDIIWTIYGELYVLKILPIEGLEFESKNSGVVAFTGTLQNRQKIKWPYLRLHTTHALDCWLRNRYFQYLFLYQKSSAWVVCRRRYDHFIFWQFHSDPGKSTTPKFLFKSSKLEHVKF